MESKAVHLCYNVKVWPVVYEIQTTNTSDIEQSWTVSRPSASGFVTNGPDQNIADTDSNIDTITTASKPALGETTLAPCVRMYITKTNARAPSGNNVNIAEIELLGTNPDLHPHGRDAGLPRL